ncbi:hypothetical protein [Parerythrobacter aestuarii]|uniref:hypothetical protein n=1 Tax=Parerythrobacter aestuarii TaxID=3020909 RepID=UPI0024DEE5FE|nr:hypothetical protein [Parerythrobacter aestuarii]
MPRRRRIEIERNELVARIISYNRSYYISRNEIDYRKVGDEAILEIAGTVEAIGKKHKKLIGAPFEATLICACEYSAEQPLSATASPRLFGVTLKGGKASILVYLPMEPFWALPSMIASKEITHIEAIYGKPHYGDADLDSLHFASSTKFDEIRQ